MPSRAVNKVRTLTALVLLLSALAAGGWFARAPLLRAAAEAWIVSDTVTPADAVAVLGGGLEVRPFAAAEYYRSRLAMKVLLANVRAGRSERLGVLPPHAELNRQVLLKLGVPPNNVEGFGYGLANTREEALALRYWADRGQARSLIVPTEIFSSRRVHWMLERAFEGSRVRVQVPALDAPEYTRADWWQHEQGLIAFQNEVIKYVYYRFKY